MRRQLNSGLPPDSVRKKTLLTQWAIQYGNLDILNLLLQSGADVNKWNGFGTSALYFAVEKNDIEAVKLLLEHDDILVDRKMKNGMNPLLNACNKGYYNIVKHLLNKGADVNAQEREGHSGLLIAVSRNHPEVVKLLLCQDDIQVDLKNDKGTTPLKEAAFRGYLDILVLLLNKGADVNAQSNKGFSSLHNSVEGNHPDVAELLLDRDGIRVDLQENSFGDSPLHLAAKNGNVVITRLLVEKGNASTHLKNWAGRTPLQVAQRFRKHAAAKLLQSLG